VVIIGAGLGGLSAALHLVAAGRDVTVLERESGPGGRCGLHVENGYRFDTGPSVLTMPDVIARTLSVVGESLADWLTLHRLDPAYRARFADGSSIDVHADVDAMAAEITATCGAADGEGYLRFVDWLRRLHRIEMTSFIDRNLDSVTGLDPGAIIRLAALGGFGRLAPKIGSFMTDDRLRRIFSFQAMYAGLAPARALALYSVITYMDCVEGVYFPEGGMHALPRALAGAAAKHGVRFRYGTAARRIEVSAGRARAVITTEGERIPADVVVVNADRPAAYAQLLDPKWTPRRMRRLRYSPSCVLVHAGSTATFPDPAHHVISFGRSWASTFAELIDEGRPMSDPSFLVSTPTLSDPNLAPPSHHIYQALFPVPNLDHRVPIDWSAYGPQYLEMIMSTFEDRGFAGFAGGAETLLIRTPADWQAAGLAAGSPFASAHTVAQTGPFRLSTLDPRIENLVFCGSHTQPGVGIPMVLISGELAGQRITGNAPATARVLRR
jgi:phytoene desaturase